MTCPVLRSRHNRKEPSFFSMIKRLCTQSMGPFTCVMTPCASIFLSFCLKGPCKQWGTLRGGLTTGRTPLSTSIWYGWQNLPQSWKTSAYAWVILGNVSSSGCKCMEQRYTLLSLNWISSREKQAASQRICDAEESTIYNSNVPSLFSDSQRRLALPLCTTWCPH